MKIGLIDVDNFGKKAKFPNIALMKLSAYHKSIGDEVEWCNPFLEYDKVYLSKVFDFTPEFNTILNSKEIVHGGCAYDLQNKLSDEIEHIMPDYSLYGIKNHAYGFMTRGCPRNCNFCNVSQHQGMTSSKVADLNEFWDGQKNITLLDPNIMACKDWKDVFQQLIDSKSNIDFSQGLDIRLMTEEKAMMIKEMKISIIHFAWDEMIQSDLIIKNLSMFKKITQMNRRKNSVYVLVNFNTSLEEDLLRIYTLREMDYDPYVMIYDKPNAPRIIKRLQRWVNNKFIFMSCDRFEDYGG